MGGSSSPVMSRAPSNTVTSVAPVSISGEQPAAQNRHARSRQDEIIRTIGAPLQPVAEFIGSLLILRVPHFILVQNWFEELRRLVLTN